MKQTLLLLACAVLLFSCAKENSGAPESKATIVCATTDASGITKTSAMLGGTSTIKDAKAANGQVSFYWSETATDAKALKESGTKSPAGIVPPTGGNFSYSLSGLEPSKTYHFMAAVSIDGVEGYGEVKSFETIKAPAALPEAVDLGLSVKWASCNLGATKPEGFGDYYAWGATKTCYEDGYCWENAPFNGGAADFDETYWNAHKSEAVDGSGVLLPENDIARLMLGDKWRMPTLAEFRELVDNCDSEWTKRDDVKGRKFTSRKNGKSIFLPASGCWSDTGTWLVRGAGYYWSSSLDAEDATEAMNFGFDSEKLYTDFGSIRYYGNSIRPVSD